MTALRTARDSLAFDMDHAPPTVRPQVASQYRGVLKDIAVLTGVWPSSKGGGSEEEQEQDRRTAAQRWASRVSAS